MYIYLKKLYHLFLCWCILQSHIDVFLFRIWAVLQKFEKHVKNEDKTNHAGLLCLHFWKMQPCGHVLKATFFSALCHVNKSNGSQSYFWICGYFEKWKKVWERSTSLERCDCQCRLSISTERDDLVFLNHYRIHWFIQTHRDFKIGRKVNSLQKCWGISLTIWVTNIATQGYFCAANKNLCSTLITYSKTDYIIVIIMVRYISLQLIFIRVVTL